MRRAVGVAVVVGMVASVSVAAVPAEANGTVVMCHGLRATIVGATTTGPLDGTPHDDVIVGTSRNDIIRGGGGDDVICGGRGADQLYGGPGNDRLYGGRDWRHHRGGKWIKVGDRLRGGGGNDLLVPGVDRRPADVVYRDAIFWISAQQGLVINAARGTAVGQGHDTFVGTGAWLVLPTRLPSTVYGGPGRDFVDGVFSGSKIYGRGGNDVVRYVQRGGLVHGGSGNDTIQAYILFGDQPPLDLRGGPGRDRLTLTRNTLGPGFGGLARWNMATGAFTYTLGTRSITFTARGFEVGTPYTASDQARWVVRGTAGDDRLSLADTAAGGTFRALDGNDTFRGSSADDIFNGGDGTDRSLGMGAGNDTCVSVEIYDVNDCEVQQP